MIPDPENGETSSKSNPARRFLSPFTEDRIRSGQVWLAPHLSLSLQKIEYVSENCEQAPIFFRLSLSLQKTGGCSEILENKFSRFRRAFTIFAPETKTIQTYGVQFQRDRSQVAAPKRNPIAWKPIPHVPNSTCSTCSPTLRVRVCTSDTRWAISLRTSTRATNGFAASTYFIRWATTLSACLPNSTPFRRGSTLP